MKLCCAGGDIGGGGGTYCRDGSATGGCRWPGWYIGATAPEQAVDQDEVWAGRKRLCAGPAAAERALGHGSQLLLEIVLYGSSVPRRSETGSTSGCPGTRGYRRGRGRRRPGRAAARLMRASRGKEARFWLCLAALIGCMKILSTGRLSYSTHRCQSRAREGGRQRLPRSYQRSVGSWRSPAKDSQGQSGVSSRRCHSKGCVLGRPDIADLELKFQTPDGCLMGGESWSRGVASPATAAVVPT